MSINIIWIIAGAFGIVLFFIIGVFIWLRLKSGKKYAFLFYPPSNPNKVNVIYGQVKADPVNKKNKLFSFAETDSKLPVRPPTKEIAGVLYREITLDKHNDFVYIKKNVLIGQELSYVLDNEEKQLALLRIKESNIEYQNPMNKYQAYTLIAGFILILLIVIGVVYSTIAYVNNSKDMASLAKENYKVAQELTAITNTLLKVNEQQIAMLSAITGNVNITRQLS